ncbi:unnamed protein product [Ambrosiozyma monospora]|uniref:Unnamed protein product n=1 Tax=Ambrosiozyma monospora TaxID=43982 RepID=A0ACB5TBJ4_AMBMO|nr:unnamed protein product [Ambrosiozyma monospora]
MPSFIRYHSRVLAGLKWLYNGIHKTTPKSHSKLAQSCHKFLSKRAVICGDKRERSKLNILCLNEFKGTSGFPPQNYKFRASDKLPKDHLSKALRLSLKSEKVQSSLDANCLPTELSLEILCPLVLIRNVDPQAGLIKGLLVIFLGLVSDSGISGPEALYVLYKHNGTYKNAVIKRCFSWEPTELTNNNEMWVRRRQFPVILGFAMTVHHSQGKTFDRCLFKVSKKSSNFLYTGFTRVAKSSQIRVLNRIDDEDSKSKTKTMDMDINKNKNNNNGSGVENKYCGLRKIPVNGKVSWFFQK